MNYVLIYPDELRAESMACYGHPTVQTPNMDALAAEGTLFEQNYTQHPVCMASRVCLLTGHYPHVDGRRTFMNPLSDTTPNFIADLNRAGYTTCLAGKDDCFDPESTKRIFTETVSFSRPPIQNGEGCYTMFHEAIDDCVDDHVIEGSIDFLNRHKDDEKPFFLWVSLLNPHPTYMAFEKYQNMYDPDELPPQRTLEWLKNKPEFYELTRKYRHLDEEPDELFRKIYAVYLGMITYTDDLVGRIVDTLKANGQYENTTIVLCSDHGDFGGDAGLVEKWPSGMDDMLTRVPLIVRRPGCPAGHRVQELTQSIDIFPTLFDFDGIKVNHDHFGVSLRPQIEGAAGDPERAVYCEGGYDAYEKHCFEGYPRTVGHNPFVFNEYLPKMLQQQERPESVCRVTMQRYKNWKLNIRTNGENELYDMEKDPLEYENLYQDPAYQEIRSELAMKMLTWYVSTSDVTPWNSYRLATES